MGKAGLGTSWVRRGEVEGTGTRCQNCVSSLRERRGGSTIEGERTASEDESAANAGEPRDHDELICCRSRVGATQEKKGTETMVQTLKRQYMAARTATMVEKR